ncbi:Piso0_001527 [Millerozyma farinosa CBS 7064]|uniref:Piso0_001527 protein n=1 Tax=Pichia sorbitophila (strain ATCC MYA-4447 / BCRC 22081 / CBS 7064 / NBRC 10061 / NRRL Y-12695) TaxID=559304 RepID=G8YNE4_PICSO|nr:Piso0_001527 [Millerozyma farinosa CBS 7064]
MTISSTIVGNLACQRNSFTKTLQANVVSCVPYDTKKSKSKNKGSSTNDKSKYALELSDTVLFPEGGGQPSDIGSIQLPDGMKVEVKEVLRDKLTALHVTSHYVEPETKVQLEVDWKRRFDIMQQHTGQHLVSAVLDTYGLNTLSWSMGELINYIEIGKQISAEMVAEVADKVNSLIQENLPITVIQGDPVKDKEKLKIPDDYDINQGIIRIVKIGELDQNPCCGTHLQSTSQLQSIALLHQTKIRGGNSRLHFVCGSRVYKYSSHMFHTLKALGSQLSCPQEELSDKVNQLNANYKKSLTKEQALLKEIGSIHAGDVFKSLSTNSVEYVYREDNDAEYMNQFQKALLTLINSKEGGSVNLDTKTVVMIVGSSGTGGSIKILGPMAQEISNQLKKLISALKGGGKGDFFQGKVTKYEKNELPEVFDYLESLKLEKET